MYLYITAPFWDRIVKQKKEKKEERGNGKINQKLTKLLPKGREVISERNRCGS